MGLRRIVRWLLKQKGGSVALRHRGAPPLPCETGLAGWPMLAMRRSQQEGKRASPKKALHGHAARELLRCGEGEGGGEGE